MSLFHFKRKYQAMLEDGEGETSNPVKKENNPHPDPKPTVDEASNAQANVEPNPHPRDLMAKNEFLDVLRLVKREQSELEKIANDKIKMKRILSMEIESLQKQLKEMHLNEHTVLGEFKTRLDECNKLEKESKINVITRLLGENVDISREIRGLLVDSEKVCKESEVYKKKVKLLLKKYKHPKKLKKRKSRPVESSQDLNKGQSVCLNKLETSVKII